jgi:hypothetical protein
MQQSECANFFAAIPEEPLAQVIILLAFVNVSTAEVKVFLSRYSATDLTASASMFMDLIAWSYDDCFICASVC